MKSGGWATPTGRREIVIGCNPVLSVNINEAIIEVVQVVGVVIPSLRVQREHVRRYRPGDANDAVRRDDVITGVAHVVHDDAVVAANVPVGVAHPQSGCRGDARIWKGAGAVLEVGNPNDNVAWV